MLREVPMCQLVLSQVGIVRFVEGFVSNIENYSNKTVTNQLYEKVKWRSIFHSTKLHYVVFFFFFNFVLLITEILDINFSHFLKSFS